MKFAHSCMLLGIFSVLLFLTGCGQDNQQGMSPGVPPKDNLTPEQRRTGVTSSRPVESPAGQGSGRTSNAPANYPKAQ